MKPFELTVYPALSVYSQAVVDNNLAQGRRAFDYLMLDMHCPGVAAMHRKRLTNAELAAEYWRASGGSAEVNYDRDVNAEPISRILHRFATLPPYDEVPE